MTTITIPGKSRSLYYPANNLCIVIYTHFKQFKKNTDQGRAKQDQRSIAGPYRLSVN